MLHCKLGAKTKILYSTGAALTVRISATRSFRKASVCHSLPVPRRTVVYNLLPHLHLTQPQIFSCEFFNAWDVPILDSCLPSCIFYAIFFFYFSLSSPIKMGDFVSPGEFLTRRHLFRYNYIEYFRDQYSSPWKYFWGNITYTQICQKPSCVFTVTR